MKDNSVHPVMIRVKALFDESGKTLDQLGQDMGYDLTIARKSVWQFINKTSDPRLSMLEKFANAMGIQVTDLFTEKAKTKPKKPVK